MHSLLLATEATSEAVEAVEGSSGVSSTVVVTILVAGLVAFAMAYFIVGPGRSRKKGAKRSGDIPLAMRPYHSDEELETTAMERAMSWGVALSLFCGVFLAVYWLIEPSRINDQIDVYWEEDVAAGRALFVANCATCHGTNAEGGSAPNPYGDAPWPAPRLNNIVARYEDSEIVTDIRHFMTETITQGRPGTPMAAWGAGFNGALTDFQIDNIVTYLLSIQQDEVPEVDAAALAGMTGEEIFLNNCARCHGQDLGGQVGPALDTIYQRYGADLDDPSTFEPVRETIQQTILNGRRVPSVGVMPSFANDLTPDAITAVIDYIESQQVPDGPAFGQIGGRPDPSENPTETETEEVDQ